MNKLYSVHDHWTDINKKNDVDIESIDGVIAGIKVNGEDYGGGETWNTVFEGSVTTVDDDGDIVGIIENLTLNGNSIRVTFNNTVYELPKTEHGYGAENESGIDFSTYPLFIATGEGADSCTLWTSTAGTYSLKIEEPQSGGLSDFSTAEVIVNIVEGSALYVPYLIEEVGEIYFDTLIAGSGTYNIVMYKNTASGYAIDAVNSTVTPNIKVTGNAVVDVHGKVGITGDCTITITKELH